MRKKVINEEAVMQIIADPTLREHLACLRQYTADTAQTLKSGCATCTKQARALELRRREITRAVKVCLYDAPQETIDRVKARFNAQTLVIYVDVPGYPTRVVK